MGTSLPANFPAFSTACDWEHTRLGHFARFGIEGCTALVWERCPLALVMSHRASELSAIVSLKPDSPNSIDLNLNPEPKTHVKIVGARVTENHGFGV